MTRRGGLAALHEVLSARGDMSGEAAERWQRIIGLFGIDAEAAVSELSGKAIKPARLVKVS